MSGFTGLPVSYSFYSLKKSAVYVDSFRHPGLFWPCFGRGCTLVCELLYHACILLGYGGDSVADVFFVEVADADTSTVAASSSTGSGKGYE